MDDFSRNNWIIILVIASAIILISATMVGFIGMLNNIGNNINLVVDNTSKNMTELTQVLIDQQRHGSIELNKVVDNQTKELVKSVDNLTNVIINYSSQNDQNLKNVSNLILQSKIS
jgi:predicted PurR-regulated permease PerM